MFNMARNMTGEADDPSISTEERRAEDNENSCVRSIEPYLCLPQQAREDVLNSLANRETTTGHYWYYHLQ